MLDNLQLNTGKGRIYIRPIQENLELLTAEDCEDFDEEVTKLNACILLWYWYTYTVHALDILLQMGHA